MARGIAGAKMAAKDKAPSVKPRQTIRALLRAQSRLGDGITSPGASDPKTIEAMKTRINERNRVWMAQR